MAKGPRSLHGEEAPGVRSGDPTITFYEQVRGGRASCFVDALLRAVGAGDRGILPSERPGPSAQQAHLDANGTRRAQRL
jgi:hypothetical protein